MEQENQEPKLIEDAKKIADVIYGDVVAHLHTPLSITPNSKFNERLEITKSRLAYHIVRNFMIGRIPEFAEYLTQVSLEGSFEDILSEPTNIINIEDHR